ncbi:hypothetical protein UVI_02033240 [Ustilaginoidea virens]|uniref:Uncharacterized protein n=1 Tax=Ustilaginoidea virens TaxID=1159556 RepID=A0A1B5L2N1_USTVR|nr:hypothetical protein UVI_02033240 [Ustilaginoidea virens]
MTFLTGLAALFVAFAGASAQTWCTSVVTTAAAAGIKALPGAAWDAAILAIAVLL